MNYPLTARQQEVWQLISKGMSNKEIARQLNCSEGTIKIHVSSVFRAIGVKKRSQAAVAFVRLEPAFSAEDC